MNGIRLLVVFLQHFTSLQPFAASTIFASLYKTVENHLDEIARAGSSTSKSAASREGKRIGERDVGYGVSDGQGQALPLLYASRRRCIVGAGLVPARRSPADSFPLTPVAHLPIPFP